MSVRRGHDRPRAKTTFARDRREAETLMHRERQNVILGAVALAIWALAFSFAILHLG